MSSPWLALRVWLFAPASRDASWRVDLSQSLTRPLDMVYGHDVVAEAVGLDGRLELWRGPSLCSSATVLGFGFDGAPGSDQDRMVVNSHNGFLEVGLAGGIFSGAIFLVVAGVLRVCLASAPGMRRHSLLAFAYMIIIAFTGITFTFLLRSAHFDTALLPKYPIEHNKNWHAIPH